MSVRYVYYESDGVSQSHREIVEELDPTNQLTAATAIWDRMVMFYNGYIDKNVPLKYKIQRIYIGSAGINEARFAKDMYFHYDISLASRKLLEQLLKFNVSAVVHLLPKSHFLPYVLNKMANNKVSVDSIDQTTQEPIYPLLFDKGHQVVLNETPSGLGVTETIVDPSYSDEDDKEEEEKVKEKTSLKLKYVVASILGFVVLKGILQRH